MGPLLANADEVIGDGHAQLAQRHDSASHPLHTKPYVELLGLAGHANGGRGELHGFRRQFHSRRNRRFRNLLLPEAAPCPAPAGEIYRLKASVPTPACASTSPQAAIIITAFRNYGIILADNGDSGGLIGTPDARWNDNDLSCLTSLTLSDFEPVNVSSLIVSNDSGATSH